MEYIKVFHACVSYRVIEKSPDRSWRKTSIFLCLTQNLKKDRQAGCLTLMTVFEINDGVL